MELTRWQVDRILDIIETLQAYFLPDVRSPAKGRGRIGSEASGRAEKSKAGEETSSRKRRSGKELADFQKTLLRERKAGVSVSELAQKYEVSPAYIYQLKPPPAQSKTTKAPTRKGASRKARGNAETTKTAEAA